MIELLPLPAATAAGLAVFLALRGVPARPAHHPGGIPPGTPGRNRRARPQVPVRPRVTAPASSPPPAPTMRVIGAAMVPFGITVTAAHIVGPVASAVILIASILTAMGIARRGIRLRRRRVDEAAPDLIDLFGVALAAGQPVPRALTSVAPRSPPPVRDQLLLASHRFDRGISLVEVLADLRPLGPAYEPLVDVLIAAHRGGASVLDALDRLAGIARDQRRRAAEARVRRLPVTMLFPLVLCTLPAFGLLAVVPLLVASFTDLG